VKLVAKIDAEVVKQTKKKRSQKFREAIPLIW
jgi:hypothetical protein